MTAQPPGSRPSALRVAAHSQQAAPLEGLTPAVGVFYSPSRQGGKERERKREERRKERKKGRKKEKKEREEREGEKKKRKEVETNGCIIRI